MIQNDVKNLLEMGKISTSTLCLSLGLPSLPVSFIHEVLGITPALMLGNRRGFYWDQSQVNDVRMALIRYLAKKGS